MKCDESRDQASEFALGLLTGPQRADMVEHLAGCPACRRLVDADAAALDLLLTASLSVEPPAGFEGRVLDRISAEAATVVPVNEPATRRARRRAPRWSRPALVAAAVIALVMVGAAIGGLGVASRDRGTPVAAADSVRSASMISGRGWVVGRSVVAADPDTLLVSVPGWSPPGWKRSQAYDVRLTLADGGTRVVHRIQLHDGVWAGRLSVPGASVRAVAMLDEYGRVLCHANLPA